ncbi:MAG: hypothetical protein ACRDLB_14435 [Actinomycetota bacterium]
MTRYQFFLLMVLILWPFVIMGMLFLMNRIEGYVARTDADSPADAGLEPVAGEAEREIKIVFGDHVVGE